MQARAQSRAGDTQGLCTGPPLSITPALLSPLHTRPALSFAHQHTSGGMASSTQVVARHPAYEWWRGIQHTSGGMASSTRVVARHPAYKWWRGIQHTSGGVASSIRVVARHPKTLHPTYLMPGALKPYTLSTSCRLSGASTAALGPRTHVARWPGIRGAGTHREGGGSAGTHRACCRAGHSGSQGMGRG